MKTIKKGGNKYCLQQMPMKKVIMKKVQREPSFYLKVARYFHFPILCVISSSSLTIPL